MGGKASRDKGKRGERMFASLLREHGFDARRGVQYQGSPDSPDVVGLPGAHTEVKFVEKLNLHSAMEQSKRDAGEGEMPIVAHKRSREEWLVTMRFDDWIELFKAWEGKETQNNGRQNVDDGTSDGDGE